MLTNLHVKNLALIDEIEVEFGPGLNILTGETGAGKSIIIGSVNLALGKKMSKEMIREGEQTALVELIFHTENPKVIKKLKQMDLDAVDGQVIITRKISENRSISKINGETCTAAQIRQLAEDLLDIHGQHEHQSLLYPDRQLEILDGYGKAEIDGKRRETENAYQVYHQLQKELETYQMNEEERAREIAFLSFEIQEIEDADLKQDEDQELEQSYRRMCNAKKLNEHLNQVYLQTGYGNHDSAGEQVGRALRELMTAQECDEALNDMVSMLRDIDDLLNDFNREVSAYLSEMTFSDETFFQVEKRLDQWNALKAKYGNSYDEILSYKERQSEKLEQLQNFETRKQEVLDRLLSAEQILETASHNLSECRKGYAKKLEQEIVTELQELNFAEVRFKINFARKERYAPNGFDAVEFQISTNPGEPEKSLAKVVSGGELSRIMLAIKTILAEKDDTETLIFDEIDTGISGRTAQMVSEKMDRIGRTHQVLCITHLPQIAAMADEHYEIVKKVENMETRTMIRKLSKEASIRELARILGGAKITEAVEENAKEMKELAAIQKTSRL